MTTYSMSVPSLPGQHAGEHWCRLFKSDAGQAPEVIGAVRVHVSGTEVDPVTTGPDPRVRILASDGHVYAAVRWEPITNQLVADAVRLHDEPVADAAHLEQA